MKNKIKYTLKVISGLLISLILLLLLLSKTSISQITQSMTSFPPTIVLSAFVLYLFLCLFRTLRFRILLNHPIALKDLFSIVCIHNFFTQIIPARLGELSYIYMVRKRGIPLNKNISSIAIARLFDMCMVSIIFFVGLAATPLLLDRFYSIFIASIIILVIVVGFLFFASTRPEAFILLASRITKKAKNPALISISSKIGEIFHEFKILRSKHILVKIILSSLLVWLSAYISAFFLLNSIFSELNLFNVFLVASIPVFISILPIHAFAGLGTTEAGYLFPLLLFGIAVDDAISAGFAVHILQLLFIIALAIVGYAMLVVSSYKKAR